MWSRICRWEPQGRPCNLNPSKASLHHVNENKYGDCDIRSPYDLKFLERKALFSEGPAPWGRPRSGSSCGFMTCQEAGMCRRGEGLLRVLTPKDTEPCWSGHATRRVPRPLFLLLQAQDSFISVCTELEKNTMS